MEHKKNKEVLGPDDFLKNTEKKSIEEWGAGGTPIVPDKSKRSKNSSNKKAIIIAIIALVLLFLIIATIFGIKKIKENSNQKTMATETSVSEVAFSIESDIIEIPMLEGKTIEEVQSFLSENNINFKVFEENSDTIEKGIVIFQSVEEGSRITENSLVYLTVSLGKAAEKTTVKVNYDSGANPKPSQNKPVVTEKETEIKADYAIISVSTSTLLPGESTKISVDIYPKNAKNKNYMLISGNNLVVSVEENNTARAVSPGSTIIEVYSTDGRILGSVYITVKEPETKPVVTQAKPIQNPTTEPESETIYEANTYTTEDYIATTRPTPTTRPPVTNQPTTKAPPKTTKKPVVKYEVILFEHEETGIASVLGEGTYKPGEKVTVKANLMSGYKFKYWYDVSGEMPDGTDKSTEQTYTFIMPERNVQLNAYGEKEKVLVKKTGSYSTSAGTLKIKGATTGYKYISGRKGSPYEYSLDGTSYAYSDPAGQGTYSTDTGLNSGGTVFEISNWDTVAAKIKNSGENAKITSIEVKLVRRNDPEGKRHGVKNANGYLYATSNKVSDYDYGDKPSGTKVSTKSNWSWGSTFTAKITDRAVLDNFLSGKYRSFMLYAGTALADYVLVTSISVVVNYEYYVYQ